MSLVSQSYKACEAAGHRNPPETPVGCLCAHRFDADEPCYGRVQEYWEKATPISVPETWPRLQKVVDWIVNVKQKLKA